MMNARLCNKGFYIVENYSRDIRLMRKLPHFLDNISYDEIGMYGILRMDDLEPKDCMDLYLDYNIQYYEYIIDDTRKILHGMNLSPFYSDLLCTYIRDLDELRKSR